MAKQIAKPAPTTKTRSIQRPTATAVKAERAEQKQVCAAELLTRVEADLNTAIDTLNQQMSAVLSKFTEVIRVPASGSHVIVRTAPLDRATATFHRLVSEVVEDQYAEMLPSLITLRQEMAQRVAEAHDGDDFFTRGTQTLDHVLTLVHVQAFQPRVGEPFDSLIHLAVGESRRDDLADGVVAEVLQAGYRTARGKIVTPARILVNRR